jgi:hypothetical protein
MSQRRPFAILASLGWAAVTLACAVIAACTSGTPQPAPLGDCVHRGTLVCGGPVGGAAGGGGGEGGSDGGDAGDSDAGSGPIADAASCGMVDTILVTTNQACVPCIVSGTGSPNGTSCCQAAMACSADPECIVLLGCAQMIPPPNCAATHQAALAAYDDFAQCLQMNCGTQCPMLPQGADF